ncbi:MAG TPA: aminoacetone oxidase family FAD-binding enzyme, partial [bacterium]|nr:aminoacetone oxidase family FAD-binding enzyme [bacterium]
LTGLVLDGSFTKRLKGVRCQAAVSILRGERIVRTEAGEIQFTEDGLSGIPVLGMARSVHEIHSAGENASIQINLFPEWSAAQVSAHLAERFRMPGDVSAGDALVSLIHKRLIPVLLKACGVDAGRNCSNLPGSGLENLVTILTGWRIPVSGTRSWNDAQVTAGGVAVDEIRPQTLESARLSGLFFAGELIDVDGDCGGYNLQWAWSSGRVAGTHAARS